MKDFDAQQLAEQLRSAEAREAYAEGFLSSWISHQLTVLRLDRKLTQAQLAERVGTQQPGIARMERDDYGKWNLLKLQRVAFALGCRLKVSFETFGSLVKEAAELSELSLLRPPVEQDPVLYPDSVWTPQLREPGPLGEFRRRFLPWLAERGPSERLAEWLQGYDLPAVGDEITPAEWMLDAVLHGDPKFRIALAKRVRRAIVKDRWDVKPPGSRKEEFVRHLLRLAEGLRAPAILGDALFKVCDRRAYVVLAGSDKPWPGHPLARAIRANQPDGRFREFWTRAFLAHEESRRLEEYAPYGLLGLAYIGSAPDAVAIAQGAKVAGEWRLRVPEIIRILASSFEAVWVEFADRRFLSVHVLDAAKASSIGWSEAIMSAWWQSVRNDLPPQPPERIELVRNVLAMTGNASG